MICPTCCRSFWKSGLNPRFCLFEFPHIRKYIYANWCECGSRQRSGERSIPLTADAGKRCLRVGQFPRTGYRATSSPIPGRDGECHSQMRPRAPVAEAVLALHGSAVKQADFELVLRDPAWPQPVPRAGRCRLLAGTRGLTFCRRSRVAASGGTLASGSRTGASRCHPHRNRLIPRTLASLIRDFSVRKTQKAWLSPGL
jgi:hypothetical protein